MKPNEPSRTAAWVAAVRGLGAFLPQEARLSDDPFGLRFARPVARVARAARRFPRIAARVVAHNHVLSIQIRTRVLDDVLLDFVAQGGRQVLLLGAGFDCRSARFARQLAGVTVFEVDHPATQDKKRRVIAASEAAGAPVVYVPWDFEGAALSDLPDRLAAQGHRRGSATLTIWEGVCMYLSPQAVDAAVAAVADLSAPGSPFAFTYLDRAAIERPPLRMHLLSAFVAGLGEPLRYGWDPQELPGWLSTRGFALVSDRTHVTLARDLFPPRFAATAHGGLHHIAVAERAG